MKYLIFKLFLIFVVFYILLYSHVCLAYTENPLDCEHTDTRFNCVTYISNYDGDTITVDIPKIHPFFGIHAHVRVYGIDAPEIDGKGPCEKKVAEEAKNRVVALLIAAKRIDLTNLGTEKYGRILAEVLADNVSIGPILLKEKLAYEYYGDTKKKIDWCTFKK